MMWRDTMEFTQIALQLSMAINLADIAGWRAVNSESADVYAPASLLPGMLNNLYKEQNVQRQYLQAVASRAWEAKFRDVMDLCGRKNDLIEKLCKQLKFPLAIETMDQYTDGLISTQEAARWLLQEYLKMATEEKNPESRKPRSGADNY